MADHRAGRRVASVGVKNAGPSSSSRAVSGGKRKAVKPTRATRRAASPTHSKTAVTSVPTLVGTAAVFVAAAGAISVGSGSVDTAFAAGGFQHLSGQANVLNGASGVGSSSSEEARKLAISRDSARMAQADAAGEVLEEELEAQVKQRNAALAQLAARAESHAAEVAKNAWQLPLTSYNLSARFGECSPLWSNCHTGLDLSAPNGTPIHAVANGVVTEVGYDGSYGNKTVVVLEDGTEIWYCHQSAFGANVGETVVGGQTIGYVGSTGNTTGPHLHLEVHPGAGDAVDPYAALYAHGVAL
ncbi:MAG TPA: M23 family metallopeptidase [Nocardioidaceae bacterium]|nr:M23 family metallopeptidase [Nocardioidaceae bacterium]